MDKVSRYSNTSIKYTLQEQWSETAQTGCYMALLQPFWLSFRMMGGSPLHVLYVAFQSLDCGAPINQ